jgi:hypothetical protein
VIFLLFFVFETGGVYRSAGRTHLFCGKSYTKIAVDKIEEQTLEGTKINRHKLFSTVTLTLLTFTLLSTALICPVFAQTTTGSATTIGLWHLNEIAASGDNVVTLDSVGQNAGIIGGTTDPTIVNGKFDEAMSFDGNNFVYVPIKFLIGFPPSAQPIYQPISPQLDIQNQIKIDAWVNTQSFTNATYNNIVVKCTRTDASWYSTSRVVGLAIRGFGDEDGAGVVAGCLSGFVRTESGDFNEIVTAQPVVTLGQWMHVTFSRTPTGMHLFVNGYEQAVTVIHGVQNPTGKIMNGTEIYFGHDANLVLDEVSIVDLAPEVENSVMMAVDIGPNLLIAAVAIAFIFAVAWLLRRAIQMRVIHSRSS